MLPEVFIVYGMFDSGSPHIYGIYSDYDDAVDFAKKMAPYGRPENDGGDCVVRLWFVPRGGDCLGGKTPRSL